MNNEIEHLRLQRRRLTAVPPDSWPAAQIPHDNDDTVEKRQGGLFSKIGGNLLLRSKWAQKATFRLDHYWL